MEKDKQIILTPSEKKFIDNVEKEEIKTDSIDDIPKEKVETRGRKKKEKEEINPIVEKINSDLDLKELQNLGSNLSQDIFIDNKEKPIDKIDTFFKTLADNLFTDKNISLKTEYINEDEQFAGTKLDFMIKKGGFNLGKTFLHNWKKDRVSLGRKSRQEIIMLMWERDKERRRQEELENRFNNTMGMN